MVTTRKGQSTLQKPLAKRINVSNQIASCKVLSMTTFVKDKTIGKNLSTQKFRGLTLVEFLK